MATVQIYLKPRPVSLVHGYYHYLPFYSPIMDHTLPTMERYPAMPQKSTLSSLLTLSTLFNDFMPSIDVDVPDPSKFDRSAWPDLELAKMKSPLRLIYGSSVKIILSNSPKVTMHRLPYLELSVLQ